MNTQFEINMWTEVNMLGSISLICMQIPMYSVTHMKYKINM